MDTADRILDEILACMGGSATPEQCDVIDFLSYRTYRHNRELGTSAAELAKLWQQTGAAMERRYQDEATRYADAMIQRDKEARHTGKPEHDRDTFGRPMKEGA